MFLESITACGFLGIDKAQKFECEIQKDIPLDVNNRKKNITNLRDSTFIKAFSIIFDTKYGAGCDLSEFINDRHKRGQPFVEVVLWQNDEIALSEHKWLKNKRLTFVRNLLQPKFIVINGKSLDVSEFHSLTTSLGFIRIGDFQMHRLLDKEFIRLGHLTGEDLWNLVLKVNESKDLVQIIGKKHKLRKVLNNQMEKHMTEMEEVLPLKLQVRDKIRSYQKLTREFKTLMFIINNRKVKILAKEKAAIDISLENLATEINERNKALVELKFKDTENKLKHEKQKELYELLQEKTNDLRGKILKISINQTSPENLREIALEQHKRLSEQHKTSSQILEELEALANNGTRSLSEKQTQIEIIKWKLLLKETKNETLLQMNLKQLDLELNSAKSSLSYYRESLQEIIAEIAILKAEMQMGPLDLGNLKDTARIHHELKLDLTRQILKFDSKILEFQKNYLNISEEMAVVTILGQTDISTVKTLSAIEDFVNKHKDLSVDYLGPVLKYLKADPEIDIKMWGQLKTVVNIILFSRGSTARKVNRMLVDSGINLGSYAFLGIDEFVPSAYNPPGEELAKKIKSAELLVPDDVIIKNILKQLLREFILINEEDLGVDEHSMSPTMIVYSSAGIITETNQLVTFQSALPSYAESKNMSPIDVLQNIYNSVKNRLTEVEKIAYNKTLKLKLEERLQDEEEKYQEMFKSLNNIEAESESIAAFQQILTALEMKIDLENQFHLKVAQTRELTEMTRNTERKIRTWDADKLSEMLQRMQLELFEEEKKSTEVKQAVEIKRKQLKNSIEIMEIHKQLLMSCFSSVDELTESSSANKTDFVKLYQEHLDVYDNQLKGINEDLLKVPEAVEIDPQLDLDIFESRCRFYKQRGELDVVVSVMKQCMKDIDEIDETNCDQSAYELRKVSNETIKERINDCVLKLQHQKQSSSIDSVTTDQYGHLVESIKRVREYCESPDQAPILRNKIAARTFPVINKVIVKMLKDAVHNYSLAFNYVMEKYIKSSTLFFYTHGLLEEIKQNDFSWNCFDLNRLKAMEFVVHWKDDGREKIAPKTIRTVKGLLLIMYIISYLSIFKFVIIDEKIFEDIDDTLKENIKKFFEIISPYVQIILLNEDSDDAEMSIEQPASVHQRVREQRFFPTLHSTPLQEPMDLSD